MKIIINLTPHVVSIGSMHIEPSGQVARASVTETEAGSIAAECGDIQIFTTILGMVVGVPAPVCGTVYIVSTLVRLALPGRPDLASPYGLVRDGAGAVIGCRGLEVTL